MIAWAIDACLSSAAFDLVVVSTDDPEIARVAQQAGAQVPFTRPAGLSDDFTPILPVITHALAEVEATSGRYELACCVYATASTLQVGDIHGSARLLLDTPDADYCVGVSPFSHPIERAMRMTSDSRISFTDPRRASTRTQDLPTSWHDAGQLVWGRRDAWLEERPILDNAIGFPMPEWRAVDVDSEEDWQRAEAVHRILDESAPDSLARP